MRFALLIAAILTLGLTWSAPALSGPEVPQALAAAADACPEAEDDEGGADEAKHVTKSGDPAVPGAGGEDEETDEDAPPKFSSSFHRRWFSMDASTDGFEAPPELPVSIEAVCDLPVRLQTEGDQLSGTDGVAIVSSQTRIVKDGAPLSGTTATTELEGADTVFLKVRLFRPANWREDEDGNKIPTFRAKRAAITD